MYLDVYSTSPVMVAFARPSRQIVKRWGMCHSPWGQCGRGGGMTTTRMTSVALSQEASVVVSECSLCPKSFHLWLLTDTMFDRVTKSWCSVRAPFMSSFAMLLSPKLGGEFLLSSIRLLSSLQPAHSQLRSIQ